MDKKCPGESKSKISCCPFDFLIWFPFVCSTFPQFWETLEQGLEVDADDIAQAKSVLTALGFLTKSSIASIRTPKRVRSLERDFTKIRLSPAKFDLLCSRYPLLSEIDLFTPGLGAVLLGIVNHLNWNEYLSSSDSKGEEQTKKTILQRVQKVFLRTDKCIHSF